jgi:protein SCO1/2
MKNIAWVWILIAVVVLILVAAFVLPEIRPYQFHGSLIESQELAPDFTLTTQNAQTASLSDFRGKLVILYFGYTYCPDVCPATLAEVNKALDRLGEKAGEVQVVMITVDPQRDTPQKLSEYLAHFNPGFLGLTGSPEQIVQVAADYGIYYGKRAGSQATNYLVDHTASLIVVDQDGYLRLIFPFGTPANDIAEDLTQVMK